MTSGNNTKGAMLALLAFAVFATHDVFVKILGASYAPVQIVFFSVLFSFPLATLMLIRDANPGTLLPKHPWWVGLRTATTTVTTLSGFYAFSVLPLAQVYAILFAMPLIITILAIPMLGETVRLRRWLAILVGLSGVLVVLRPGSSELTFGHLAALSAAFGAAIASIIVRKIGSEERPVVMLLYPLLANFILMGIALPFFYEPMPLAHLGMVAIVSALGWIAGRFVIAAYSTGEAVIVAPMQYSQIIWASLFGTLIFNESLDQATIIGATIVIASGMYIVLRESRGSNSENTPVLRTRSRLATPSSLRISSLLRLRGQIVDDK